MWVILYVIILTLTIAGHVYRGVALTSRFICETTLETFVYYVIASFVTAIIVLLVVFIFKD